MYSMQLLKKNLKEKPKDVAVCIGIAKPYMVSS